MAHICGRLWLFFAALTLFIRPASSQTVWEPRNELAVPGDSKPTVPREPITRLRVAAFTVILEKTTFSDVQSHFGGTIGQRGDASEALA